LKFSGLQKTSLIDFPNRVASVLYTPGCNLRCPYCHNWRIAFNPSPPFLSEDEALRVLEGRKKYVDAVVVTGGEPTIHEGLPLFLEKLKRKGFAVKLDTNGFRPDALKACLPWLDYVALDVKTSPEKYRLLGAPDPSPLIESIRILKECSVDYEFRTTVVPSLVDAEDIKRIGEVVKDAKRLALQQFIPENAYSAEYKAIKPYDAETIHRFAEALKPYVKTVLCRL